ncbi:Gldg family protein [Candidatus Venteria ishoeyi]|uniref:DUF4350 domain-containing protein n=1 Tax=Candidatus Venteria ishoeyi TaxID=1899563 RepID=UPI0025A60640|nr:DUF4350 domain-containing protein [Candidatus Venteria ishoeyi]MDM8545034.1 Gldg family protein [Candidatus Venteria ishoeyi]
MIATIALRELRSLFSSPQLWMLLALTLTLLAWFFLLSTDYYLNQYQHQADAEYGFTLVIVGNLFSKAAHLLLLILPLLSMSLINAERRQQTLALLLCAPVSPWQIIVGKYLALQAILLFLLALLSLMPLALISGGSLDVVHTLSALLGCWLLMSLFAAVGLLFSSLSKSAMLAAGGSFSLLLLLWGIDWQGTGDDPLVAWLSTQHHYAALLKGQVRLQDVVYFPLLALLALWLATSTLARQGHRHALAFKKSINLLLLFIAISLAWLSVKYDKQWDWTANHSHSLSFKSQQILKQLPEPLQITAYVGAEKPKLRQAIRQFLHTYQQHKNNLHLHWLDPALLPNSLPDKRHPEALLHIRYQTREAFVSELKGNLFTTQLQGLTRSRQHNISFLRGHGERDPLGNANFDLGTWGIHLTKLGLQLHLLDLAQAPQVPDNTDVLVIASPRISLAPGEVQAVLDYLQTGGQLLCLFDPSLAPDSLQGLAPLAKHLGFELLPGQIIDPSSQRLFGLRNASIAMVSNYPAHPISKALGRTLFPQASALKLNTQQTWESTALLQTGEQAWRNTDWQKTSKALEDNPTNQEKQTLGILWQRTLNNSDKLAANRQRIAVLGDGDFLSNQYVDNHSNLELGIQLLNWLLAEETQMEIPLHTAIDAKLVLSESLRILLTLGFLFILPGFLLLMAVFFAWQKRRRIS